MKIVELVVVLSILSLLLVISFPGMRTFAGQTALISSAKTLASDLRCAQSQAVLKHQLVTYDASKLPLPAGISLLKLSDIKFSASGCPPPGGSGTLVLKDSRGRSKMVVVSSSGRVRIE